MQPIIKTNAWYTLVSAKSELVNVSWCKQQLTRILRNSNDTIVLFDASGNYTSIVLDHDRIVSGKIPMMVEQYKSVSENFVHTHTIKVDVEDSQTPRLLVIDISRVMAASWKKGVAAITGNLKASVMREQQTEPVWLFLNIDPYSSEPTDGENWKNLESVLKDKELRLKPVFFTRNKSEREINERLHIEA